MPFGTVQIKEAPTSLQGNIFKALMSHQCFEGSSYNAIYIPTTMTFCRTACNSRSTQNLLHKRISFQRTIHASSAKKYFARIMLANQITSKPNSLIRFHKYHISFAIFRRQLSRFLWSIRFSDTKSNTSLEISTNNKCSVTQHRTTFLNFLNTVYANKAFRPRTNIIIWMLGLHLRQCRIVTNLRQHIITKLQLLHTMLLNRILDLLTIRLTLLHSTKIHQRPPLTNQIFHGSGLTRQPVEISYLRLNIEFSLTNFSQLFQPSFWDMTQISRCVIMVHVVRFSQLRCIDDHGVFRFVRILLRDLLFKALLLNEFCFLFFAGIFSEIASLY
mmetsp:Transcript_18546/g.28840  ORF Transcript_18546/g.28840 Transcript_18546/m.28840 type:complete len:330 (+) Transcript_18546:190-1179(+)